MAIRSILEKQRRVGERILLRADGRVPTRQRGTRALPFAVQPAIGDREGVNKRPNVTVRPVNQRQHPHEGREIGSAWRKRAETHSLGVCVADAKNDGLQMILFDQ